MVAPAGRGCGDRAANSGPFRDVFKETQIHEDRNLLPMVVPTFSLPLPPHSLSRLPPHGAPLAKVQRLQESFNKLCEMLKNTLGNVENMNARLGHLERKVQGSLPQVWKKAEETKTLDGRVRERKLFKDTLPEFVQTKLYLRITQF